MTKTHCDVCDRAIDGKIEIEVMQNKSQKTTIAIKAHICEDSNTNKFDICKYCLVDALNRIDDRPRQAI